MQRFGTHEPIACLSGCMLHPGGGKNDIPNRAKRHFHVMNVTLPAAASISRNDAR